MSLLIKALEKAEQSKEEAANAPTRTPTPSAELELELDQNFGDTPSLSKESGFDEVATPRVKSDTATQSNPQSKTEPIAQRNTPQAAANLFKAKESTAAPSGAGNRALWLAIAGVLIFLLAGGGFYYYLNSL